MKSISVLILCAGVSAACSESGIASFVELDRDSDGRISEQEAGKDSTLVEVFAQVDADRDGQLTALEYLEAATR